MCIHKQFFEIQISHPCLFIHAIYLVDPAETTIKWHSITSIQFVLQVTVRITGDQYQTHSGNTQTAFDSIRLSKRADLHFNTHTFVHRGSKNSSFQKHRLCDAQMNKSTPILEKDIENRN